MEKNVNVFQESFLLGQNFLKNFLSENFFDFFSLKEEEFVSWIQTQINKKKTDPSFYKRCEIRDLYKSYHSEFTILWERQKQALKDWQACPFKERWEYLEKKISGIEKAIEGLSHAVEEKSGEKRLECIKKLETFKKEFSSLKQEKESLFKTLVQKHSLDSAEEDIWNFKEKIGLNHKEKELEEILHNQATSTTRAGSKYENIAIDAIKKCILPIIQEKLSSEEKASLKILSHVTLGCAKAEIDYLVVLPTMNQGITNILALIEVKRNINDLVWGFLTRQENLSWFTGDSHGYHVEEYRTHFFTEGHFNKTVCHEEKGEKFFFNKKSFSLFKKDGSYFLENLFFISDARPLLGTLSSEYRKILFRISTDIDFDLQNKEYVQKLFSWVKAFISPIQTRHVLALYSEKEKWANQLVFCSHRKKE